MNALFRARRQSRLGHDAPHPLRHWFVSATAVFVITGLLVVGVSLHRASSSVDAFYDPPKSVPQKPGRLLSAEPFTKGIPDTARAWRILYTTTRQDGRSAVASGIVVLGKHAPAGPRPVLAWAHGTSGYARPCAPSLYSQPWGSGIRDELSAVIRHHWLLVAPDYTGLGTSGSQPYLIGQGEGRSVLDAVRAARQLRHVSVSKRTVLWGLSQGGGAALWTRQIQRSYAPDVPLTGVAAIAPTSDMPALARHFNSIPKGMVFMAFVLKAYAAEYADVRVADYVDPAGNKLVRGASERCLRTAETYVAQAVSKGATAPLLNREPTDGALGRRLHENTPVAIDPTPLLIAQGGADKLVPAGVQRAYARGMCERGQQLDYRQYAGRGHGGVARGDSPLLPQLISWTEHRLAGVPAADSCAKLTSAG
ncbi:lipase family protein [Flexivirga sp. B27]